MKASGFQKAGWRWTRKGFKRSLRHSQQVKKATAPPKRRARKTVRIPAAKLEKLPTFAEARRMAAEKAKAAAAREAAAEVEKRAGGPARKAWHGKYDQLTPKAGDSQGDPSPS